MSTELTCNNWVSNAHGPCPPTNKRSPTFGLSSLPRSIRVHSLHSDISLQQMIDIINNNSITTSPTTTSPTTSPTTSSTTSSSTTSSSTTTCNRVVRFELDRFLNFVSSIREEFDLVHERLSKVEQVFDRVVTLLLQLQI